MDNKIKPYDYLKDSLMSEKDIEKMVDLNPYKRRQFFLGDVPEHRRFNKTYYAGYVAGSHSKLLEMAKLLREKGMEKEEIRLMINKVLGQEVLKSKDNG